VLAALRQERETRDMALGQVWPWGDAGWNGNQGYPTSERSAFQLLAYYGGSQLIADTIATLPKHVYRPSAGGPLEVLSPPWLEQPNENTDYVEFCGQHVLSWLGNGTSFTTWNINKAFGPSELYCLDPCAVDLKTNDPYGESSRSVVPYVSGQPYRGRMKVVKGLTWPGEVRGLNPIAHAARAIGLGVASERFAQDFFDNGAHLSGVIELDGDLTQEQATKLKANWMRKHSGLGKSHTPGVLDNGATWKQTSVSPSEAQFLEARGYSDAQIAGQLLLLDPTMLGIAVNSNSMTYANLEQRGIHLVQFTLMRWIIRWERLMTSLLPANNYLKLNVSALERADLKTRFEAYRIANPTAPWIATSEIRNLEELGPTPGDLQTQIDKMTAPPVAPVVPPQQNHHVVVNVPEQPIPVVNVEPRIEVHPTPITNDVTVESPIFHTHVEPTPLEITNTVDTPVVEVTNHIEGATVHAHLATPTVEVTNNLPELVTHIESPVVNMQPKIDVQSPVVNMRAAPIHIAAPNINLPQPGKIRRTFEKDADGVIIAIVEQPIDTTEEPAHESD
jgi:HK97 family phage portal protein